VGVHHSSRLAAFMAAPQADLLALQAITRAVGAFVSEEIPA
jgi:hypothetical protein